MILKQFYKKQKIDKIRYICSKNNSANAIIKISTNLALEKIIIINKVTIRLEKQVKL